MNLYGIVYVLAGVGFLAALAAICGGAMYAAWVDGDFDRAADARGDDQPYGQVLTGPWAHPQLYDWEADR